MAVGGWAERPVAVPVVPPGVAAPGAGVARAVTVFVGAPPAPRKPDEGPPMRHRPPLSPAPGIASTAGGSPRRPGRGAARRGALLLALLLVAATAVACGRASEDEINAALGITPTATPNAGQLVAATSTAASRATDVAAAAAGTAVSGDAVAELLLADGNVALGQTPFFQNCLTCHGAGGVGGQLNGANSADLGAGDFVALIRDGTGHPVPPGPFAVNRISDDQLRNLYAWLLSVSGQ